MSRCSRFQEPSNNACKNQMLTYDCNPAEKKYWNKPPLPKSVDPVLYNVMNGCWSCNHYVMEETNQKLCNRQFFDGVVYPPCNLLSHKRKN
jgi:hypothetical protein